MGEMANLICVGLGIVRPNDNINDWIDTQDDDVELGVSYNTFNVYHVEGMTKEEIRNILNLKKPEQKTAYKLDSDKNILTFNQSISQEVWKDSIDSKWKLVKNSPKRNLNIVLSETDINILKDKNTPKINKELILYKAGIDNIKSDISNLEEAVDLNAS